MGFFHRAGLSALVSVSLVGCAISPGSKPLKPEVKATINPVELYVGIAQPDLYAAFERSTAGAAGAATCGAIPGIGILLAGVCGGAMGSIDAGINASRAKTAEQHVQPLKNAALDIQFDKIFNDGIVQSVKSIPGLEFSNMDFTKTVDQKAYEQTYHAAISNSVMFVTIDYHLSIDFSTLEVSSHALVFPRSADALKAAGFPPDILKQENFTKVTNAAYRSQLLYRGKLETKAASPAEYVALWSANNAQLLRAGVNDAAGHIARILAAEIQRLPNTERTVLRKEDVGQVSFDVLSEDQNGKLLRDFQGRLVFTKTLTKAFAATVAANSAPAPLAEAKTAP